MKGFKQFLMRGNVVDLAVAVVIGAAFTTVINAFVTGVVNPLVGAIGTSDLNSYRSCISGPCSVNSAGTVTEGIYILWGSVVSAVINFVIVAAVVYFLIVLPIGHMIRKRDERLGKTPDPNPPTDTELLTEIRDALVAQRGGK